MNKNLKTALPLNGNNPMMTLHQKYQESVRAFNLEYKKAYRNIFSNDVLEKGNPWFIAFLKSHTIALIDNMLLECEIIDKLADNDTDSYTHDSHEVGFMKCIRNYIRYFKEQKKLIEEEV